MQTRLAQLRQPLPAMPATVRFLPRARDRLAAIQRFHPAHHPRRVFGQRGVTADQFLQGARAAFPVIHRRKQSRAQQLRQLARIACVALVARLQQGVLARIADHHPRHPSCQQIVQPGRMRSFFKGEVQGPTQPMNKVEDGSGVRGDHRLHHQLAVRVHYRHRNRALVDIEAQVLHTFHRVFLSSARLTAQAQQPQPTRKGRPFIMRGPPMFRAAETRADKSFL